jgi:subtilase family serine protease
MGEGASLRAMLLVAALLLPALAALAAGAPTLPDLAVAELTATPSSPVPGGRVTLAATINNSGGSSAGRFVVAFLVDGDHVANMTVRALAAGGATTVRATWTATAGHHTVKVLADAARAVNESRETNNNASLSVDIVQPRADVAVTDFAAQPSTLLEGQSASLVAHVRNDGTGAASSFSVAFSVDGRALGERRVASLGAGMSAQVQWPWTPRAGTHSAKVVADAADVLDEPDEGDNARAITLHVGTPPTPPANPALVTLDVLPAQPAPGDPVRFTATVRPGGASASGGFDVVFTLDGQPYHTAHGTFGTAPQQVTAPAWTATAGTHFVGATLKPSGRDGSAGDNVRIESFYVAAAPPQAQPPAPATSADLSVEGLRADGAATAGSPLGLVASVRNTGHQATGAFDVVLLVDGVNATSAHVPDLAPGASAEVPLVWTAEGGSHSLFAVAMPGGPDLDPSNNAFRLDLEVAPASDVAAASKPVPAPPLLALAFGVGLAALLTRRRHPE